jgi:hypothetical protein
MIIMDSTPTSVVNQGVDGATASAAISYQFQWFPLQFLSSLYLLCQLFANKNDAISRHMRLANVMPVMAGLGNSIQ